MSMPARLPRRRFLTAALAAPAILSFPRGLMAAPGTCTWDSANKSGLDLLSNGDLTANIAMSGWGLAMDLDNGKFWVYNPRTGKWNDDVIANQDPGSNVGGYSPASLTAGTYYAATWLQDSSNNQHTFNFGAATLTTIPSGFSTYNSAAGATVTLDTSFNTSGKMAYSNGDLTVTQIGTDSSGALMSRATHGLSSGKVYFEVLINSMVGGVPGIAHSTLANTNYMWNGSKKGFGVYTTYLYNNVNSGVNALGTGTLTAASSCRGTLLRTSGKLMFEATLNFTGLRDVAIGVCNSSFTPFANNVPGAADSWGYDRNTSVANIGLDGGSGSATDGLTSGQKVGIYIDFANSKLWYYIQTTARYNGSGTADPATNTGGIDISSIISGGLYPLCGGGDSTGLTTGPASVVANFGATGFTSPTPTGFRSWNDGPLGGPFSRAVIIQ